MEEQTPTGGSFYVDDDFHSMLDGFAPLNHMGMPIGEVEKLTPTDQKNQALKALPTILKQLLLKDEVADILICLVMIPDEKFPQYLQPEGFQKCLSGETGAETHIDTVQGFEFGSGNNQGRMIEQRVW